MKIATLNCRGLNKDEKILHLLHDADNHRLNVTSLQETHLKVENIISHTSPRGNKFILYNSKASTTHKIQCFGGRGFLFDEQHAPTLPTSEKTPSIRQEFYDKLDNLLHNIPNLALLYLAGDIGFISSSKNIIDKAMKNIAPILEEINLTINEEKNNTTYNQQNTKKWLEEV